MIVRPMTADDIESVYWVASYAFAEDEQRRESILARTPEEVASRQERYRRFLLTDAEGLWVAEDGESVVGVAAALWRESLWILSLFAVDGSYRGGGVGKELLRRSLDYGEGCKGAMIASSEHPAAMRRYAMAGFTLRPALEAHGVVDRKAIPAGLSVRDGGSGDLDLAAEVDRYLRGATHGPDLEFMLESGMKMLVSEQSGGRGYAICGEGPPLVAATSEKVAGELLWAALAERGEEEAYVAWMTQDQGWAVRVALKAGLSLKPEGPICTRGEIGPLTPYLPSGAFL